MKRMSRIAIAGWGSISALGVNGKTAWKRYKDNTHCFIKQNFNGRQEWVSPLAAESKAAIAALGKENIKYRQLDPSIQYAIAASRSAVEQAGWTEVKELG